MLVPTMEDLAELAEQAQRQAQKQSYLEHPVADAFLTGLELGCYIGAQDPQEARNFLLATNLPTNIQQELYAWVKRIVQDNQA